MSKLLASFALFIIISFSTNAFAAKTPDLSLKGLDGKQHAVQDYIGKGKWVIVNIWGPKCPPCVAEMPELQSFHEDHEKTDAIVVGIALDYPGFGPAVEQDVRSFAEDYFITYPLLLGDADSIEHLGGGRLRGTPTTLLFSPAGKLEAMQVGQITQAMLEKFINDPGQ